MSKRFTRSKKSYVMAMCILRFVTGVSCRGALCYVGDILSDVILNRLLSQFDGVDRLDLNDCLVTSEGR